MYAAEQRHIRLSNLTAMLPSRRAPRDFSPDATPVNHMRRVYNSISKRGTAPASGPLLCLRLLAPFDLEEVGLDNETRDD